MNAEGATVSPGRGCFVTLEGVEGSGKTTQIERLAERVRSAGRTVVTTREPGGTAVGKALRGVLLAHAEHPPTASCELLLYAADRAQHLELVVEPALARGEVVLCDRYLDATVAYQGYGRGLGAARVLELHGTPPLDRRPHRTVLLDVPVEHGLERARARNARDDPSDALGRFEAENIEFHERVRDGYHRLARGEPERFAIVDGTRPADAVALDVWHAVRAWIEP